MKKILGGLFVVTINFYFLSFLIGIAAALYTVVYGPILPAISVLIPLLSLAISFIYQETKQRFSYCSPGELVVYNSCNKTNFEHGSIFTIRRIPLFILLFLTLALPGNFLDGLSEGYAYTLPHLVSLTIMYSSLYGGITRFFRQPTLLAASLVAGGLLIAAILGHSPGESGTILFGIFSGIAALWIVAWAVYSRFKQPSSTNGL